MTADIVVGDRRGWLGWIERVGNRLPDPVFIFFYMILALMVISLVASAMDLSVLHPVEVDDAGKPVAVVAQSLFSTENLRNLLTQMPETYTHFPPLGYVLLIMLGAGVAERSGLFAAAMRGALRGVPNMLMTPMVALVSMIGNHAADAVIVVLVPLCGVIFHVVGRHPIAGIAASFAGAAGGYSANLFPGQFDALLFGITQAAANTLLGEWEANIAGNWYFMIGMTAVYLPVIWFVTDRIVEPRLGAYSPSPDEDGATAAAEGDALSARERAGLRWAGVAVLAVIGVWCLLALGPDTVLIEESAAEEARMTPFYRSLTAAFFFLFLLSGWAYGRASGSIRDHRELVGMMSDSASALAYYFVLALVAAHFIAMFGWSNLAIILAVNGANFLKSLGLPAPLLLAAIVFLSAVINIFIGSASAKWTLIAPVMVPMLLLLGISPEMTTAAYRVGDSATNIITPLMVYFPLIMLYCQRWQGDFGLGNLTALMLPYSMMMMAVGTALVVAWVALDAPLGPGAVVFAAPLGPSVAQ